MGAMTSAEGIPVISSNRAISLVLCPATEDTSFGDLSSTTPNSTGFAHAQPSELLIPMEQSSFPPSRSPRSAEHEILIFLYFETRGAGSASVKRIPPLIATSSYHFQRDWRW